MYVLDAYEGGLPSARYLGLMADCARPPAPRTTTSPRCGCGRAGPRAADTRYGPVVTPTAASSPRSPLLDDPYSAAKLAAQNLAELTGVDHHDVAIVLGSGWVPAADLIGQTSHDLAVTDLPGFSPPAVEGHAGRLRSVTAGDKRVLVFLGRTHLYEGRGVAAVRCTVSAPRPPPAAASWC